MVNPPPPVSIIIPCRNERHRLPRVLDCLAQQRGAPVFEVVVADGMSDDGTWEWLQERAAAGGPYTLRPIRNVERTIPAGLNCCVAAAVGTWIIRIDAHADLPEDYIATMAANLATPGVDVAGGQVYWVPGGPTVTARIIAWCLNHRLGNGGTPGRTPQARPRRTRHSPLSCYRREVWERVGGYDERLLTNEDFEFDWRAGQAGFAVWTFPAPVYQAVARNTVAKLWQQRWRYGLWKARVARMHPASLSARQLIPAAALPLFLAFLVLTACGVLPLAGLLSALALWPLLIVVLTVVGSLDARPHVGLPVGWRELPAACILASVAFPIIQVVWALGFWCGLFSPPGRVRNDRAGTARLPKLAPPPLPPIQLPAKVRRVAIVHEWLEVWGGSERVMRALLDLFPEADLFVLVDALDEQQRSLLGGRKVRTSFIQRLPGARRHFRRYIPLFPMAVEQFDLAGYDLVISSSHAVAKGVLTGPDAVHLCYCHSPMRYAWDFQHLYLRNQGLDGIRGIPVRMMLHYLRMWDVRASTGVDHFVANSRYVARRIRTCYRRDAVVVAPPVDVERFALQPAKDRYYVVASRLVPYKCVPLVVEAFRSLPDHQLLVIGDGPERRQVERLAGPNVRLLGQVEDARLVEILQRARALVFAAEEDFGILPVEALACGTPVIAYGRGGVLDTIRDGDNGILFPEQTTASLIAAIRRFEQLPTFDPEHLRASAMAFSPEAFRERMAQVLDGIWAGTP